MRKKTGELALFFEIWNERPHHCQNNLCADSKIDSFNMAHFHHVISKGSDVRKRLDKNNIVILCHLCHRKVHQKGKSAIDIKDH